MLRVIQNTSPQGAVTYFISSSDYYTEGQELVGRWHGRGAQRLGLFGEVQKKDWESLCHNLHPQTGLPLTVRNKEGRRVGYDFNFHVPKSLSLVYAATRDERILSAFRDAVDQTMLDMEREMQTRVRAGGLNEDRTTGNMAWGEFVHFTSRPVDGVPDPHLHAHCFVFNTTWDSKENRWKAGQFASLKRDAPYFEAVFHSRLARSMEELGISTERTKTGWEVAGISKQTIDKFSRRTAAIEQEARDRGITDPKVKDSLGAKTRDRKKKNLSMDELRDLWMARMDASESDAIRQAGERLGSTAIGPDAAVTTEAVDRSIQHCFERQSVLPERKLLTEAIRRSVGKASVSSVVSEVGKHQLLTSDREGRRLVTTRAVLAEEGRMIDFARKGRGTCRRLGSADHVFQDQRLNKGQRQAVLHVLTSPDRVMLIRGAAGVGKTTMMKEAVSAIEAGGTRVFTFAPSADASRGVLRTEGFENADTVALLLKDEKMQEQMKGGLLWIDEAGLLGSKTMKEVFDLAGRIDARVVLSGDRKQHGSVERGAALRLLETEAGLIPAEIKEIQRQSGAYKQAVLALSEGRIAEGFRQLDDLKWIKEVPAEERYKVLTRDYVEAVRAGKSALVVSPTHAEKDRITSEIRLELRHSGQLSADEQTLPVLKTLSWTEAERAEGINYAPGHVLVYHQNAKGHKKESRVEVREQPLPLDQAARFQTFQKETLRVATGDVLRVTKGGTTMDKKHRLNNGDLVTVHGFTPEGNLMIDDKGRTIAKDYGFLTYGYVVTSHASQGKSVQKVFIGQSYESFRASSPEQFYVSVSRGKESVTVYTDNKEELLEAVSGADERLTATELVKGDRRREMGIVLQASAQAQEPPPREPTKERELAYER